VAKPGGREDNFRAVPLLAHLSAKDLRAVANLASYLELPAGSKLTSQGAAGHEFIVVFEGQVEVIKGGTVVAELGPGDFFGEIALLAQQPRTATVIARTSVSIAVMAEAEFRALLAMFPELGVGLARAMAQRLAEPTETAI
jgi:CRP/FNR family transcriptional regulator, cyclic AMP receptor protein